LLWNNIRVSMSSVVVIHTFRTSPHVCNLSPYALKVETFLRASKIPYKVEYDNKFSAKGQIPWVEVNGEVVCDSNVIIPRLKEIYKVDIDASSSSEQRAMTHATVRMLEEHTTQIGFYYRYGLHMKELVEVLEIPNRLFKADESCAGSCIAFLWGSFQPKFTKNNTKRRGLGRHTDEELWKFSNDDLKALSDYLGKKPYFQGGKISSADCAIFGHMSQLLYIPLDFPQKKYLNEHCPNVVELVNRIKTELWPDWEQLCSGKAA